MKLTNIVLLSDTALYLRITTAYDWPRFCHIIENRIQERKNGKKTDKEDLLDILISLKDADNNIMPY
ncbi:hypothetical protein MTR_8g076795 [Medicago truncatula]|uniref:Uncharacterized protein n=1 Tax=Medicago truncatula TaxID=3880 RepID=A0A072TTC5_MEDTR|nr:hypothetical protein MTR_8g076795 [Medicago truncatula]